MAGFLEKAADGLFLLVGRRANRDLFGLAEIDRLTADHTGLLSPLAGGEAILPVYVIASFSLNLRKISAPPARADRAAGAQPFYIPPRGPGKAVALSPGLAYVITPASKQVQFEPRSGGAGFRPQRAATNFSGDPATPPSRLEEPRAGRDGRRLRVNEFSGAVRIHVKRAICRTLFR